MKEVILVTGCSTGIGRDICRVMKKRGFLVAATARRLEDLKDLEADDKQELDVTNEESIKRAVSEVMKHFSRIDILVNNAGYSFRGVLEEVSAAEAERLFDVNVFGIIRMISAVAPLMRKAGKGKIINIGSVSGRYTQAGNGTYCASKHAVEAITEAARLELAPFHIQAAVIEPGPLETEFFHTLSKNSNSLMQNPHSPYRELYQRDMNRRKRQKKLPSMAAAEKICRRIEKKRLKTRYLIGVGPLGGLGLKILDLIR